MKRLRSVLILLAVLVTSMGMGTNEIFANESFDIKEDVIYNEDNKEASIVLNATSIAEGYTLEEIKDPDGNIMDLSNLVYIVVKNATYTFEVTYIDKENIKQKYTKEVIVNVITEKKAVQGANIQALAAVDYTSQVITDDWDLLNTNGAASTTNTVINGTKWQLQVQWTLSPSGTTLQGGDTFTIGLPRNSISGSWIASNSAYENFTDSSDTVIGQWRIYNSKIEVVFNENVNGKTSVSGEFVTGTNTMQAAYEIAVTQDQNVTLGGITKVFTFLAQPIVPLSTRDSKAGGRASNQSLTWAIVWGRQGAKELYESKGESFPLLNDVYLEDELIGTTFDDFRWIYTSIFFPTDLNTFNISNQGYALDLIPKFTKITQIPGESYEDFKARLQPLQYGVYKNETTEVETVVFYYGDIGANGLKYSDIDPDFAHKAATAAISRGFYTEADYEILVDYFNATFGDTNVINGNIANVITYFSTSYDKVSVDTVKTNTAVFTSNGVSKNITGTGTLQGNMGSVTLSAVNAGLFLSDQDTNALLPNATFKLQLLNGSTNTWSDYTDAGTMTTDADGFVQTPDLGKGTYRFVEVTPSSSDYDIPNSQGYAGDVGSVVSPSFIIDPLASEGPKVSVTNVKYKYDVIYQPGTQGTFTTITKSDVVVNSATPAYDGVLGNDGKPAGNVGYTFVGWSPVLESTVTKNATYVAQWAESTNTAYKVEHYLQQPNGSYVVEETENLTGTTNATVTAEANSYLGYTLDTSVTGTKVSGVIAGDGSLVLKLYYTANINTAYKIEHYLQQPNGSYVVENTENLAGTTGSTVTAEANAYVGYTLDTSITGTKESGVIAGDGSLVLKLYYTANIDTEYIVEHYLQQPNGTYVVEETENLMGTTGNSVNAIIKEYDSHVFVEDNERNILEGVIEADGSLVLKVHYNAVKVTPPKQDIEVNEIPRDGAGNEGGVTTGDTTNTKILITTMLTMLGVMVVLLRNKKEQE